MRGVNFRLRGFKAKIVKVFAQSKYRKIGLLVISLFGYMVHSEHIPIKKVLAI
jgi:hypothetical protein